MSDKWEVPAEVMAWLCEETAMPWPVKLRMVHRYHPGGKHRRGTGQRFDYVPAPIDVGDPDTALLIDRRLAAVLGGEECGASWLLRDADSRWRICYAGTAGSISPIGLRGIPDGVTCPECEGYGYVAASGPSGEPSGEGCPRCAPHAGARGTGRVPVTVPAAARAWALCWLANRDALRSDMVMSGHARVSPAYPADWPQVVADCQALDLPLLLPIHNGEPCEVSDGA